MVIDFQKLGGEPQVRCATGTVKTGIEAIRGAGFTMEGVQRWGDSFVCRLQGRPAPDEVIPIEGKPGYTEKCIDTPPAGGYWSYWHSSDQGKTWTYSSAGASSYKPSQGEWEGWSYSLNATSTTNPEPRTQLTLETWCKTLPDPTQRPECKSFIPTPTPSVTPSQTASPTSSAPPPTQQPPDPTATATATPTGHPSAKTPAPTGRSTSKTPTTKSTKTPVQPGLPKTGG